jgi:hypothetical protein
MESKRVGITVRLLLSLLLLATAGAMVPRLIGQVEADCSGQRNCCCNQDCQHCGQSCPSDQQGCGSGILCCGGF